MQEKQGIAKRFTAVETTVEEIAKLEPGTVISHLQMGSWLLVHRQEHSSRYFSRVGAVRNILKREHGVFLDSIVREGYRVEIHGKEIEHCQRKFVSGFRTMQRGVIDAQSIRIDRIEEKERPVILEKTQRMANLIGMLKNSLPQIGC